MYLRKEFFGGGEKVHNRSLQCKDSLIFLSDRRSKTTSSVLYLSVIRQVGSCPRSLVLKT